LFKDKDNTQEQGKDEANVTDEKLFVDGLKDKEMPEKS
jgi:hypothetical protein